MSHGQPAQDARAQGVWDHFAAHPAALPKLTGHSARVLALAGRIMTVDIGELMLLVRADPASTAELLRMANSPMFFRGTVLTALDEAIIRLGRREVYNVLTSVAAQSLFRPKQQQLLALMPGDWYQVQYDAVCCAFAAAAWAHALRLGDYEGAFMLGLFGHIGRLGALMSLGHLVQAENFALPPEPLAWVLSQPHLCARMTPKMLQNWSLSNALIGQAEALHQPIFGPTDKLLHVVRLVSAMQAMGAEASAEATPGIVVTDGDLSVAQQLHSARKALGLAETQLATLQRQLTDIQSQVTPLLGKKEQ